MQKIPITNPAIPAPVKWCSFRENHALKSEYDLNRRIKPAEDSEDAEKKAGPRESVGGGAFGAGVLFHVNSSVGRDKITFLIITRKQKSLKGES